MADLNINTRDLSPWVPALDPRKVGKPCVMDGRNFLNDVNGPRSYWSSDFLSPVQMDSDTRAKITELRVDEEIWLGTPTGIWRYNETTSDYDLLLPITTTSPYWPWSVALVGNVYYFAQYNIGVWSWDDTSNTFTLHDDAAFGTDCKFICESYGRLMVLTSDLICWSALDDGSDFTPSLDTGAGYQTLALLSFNAYRVDPVATGVIISTDKGLILGTKIATNYVFSWENGVLTRDVRIFTPNAGCIIPDLGYMCLDGAGFRLTNGAVPTLWHTDMGEYLKTNYLNQVDKSKLGILNMYYSQTMRKLFVTFCSNSQEGQAEITFVWNAVNDKWSVFSIPHFGVFEQHSDLYVSDFGCYMGVNGYLHEFTEANYTEAQPDDVPQLELFYSLYEDLPAMHYVDNATAQTITILSSEMQSLDADPNWYSSVATNSGAYILNDVLRTDPTGFENDVDDPATFVNSAGVHVCGVYVDYSEVGFVRMAATGYNYPQQGLDSYVQLGLFRFEAQQDANETSMVSTIVLGITPAANFVTYQNWNTMDDATINYNDSPDTTVVENWGAGFVTPDSFDCQLSTTNDGSSALLQGDEDLQLIDDEGAGNLYKPYGWSGVYHSLKIYAEDVGDAFYIRTIDLSGTMTGLTQ